MSDSPHPQTFVVGTAGHIDHGKSTLVRALTGIDPDRLVEEKVRGMTIDLGFAWLTTPAGRQVSIVDVPGHERFIKNMLAGVGGIDAALLVVAADEGPMPQTVEHLAILDLLRVPIGIVVVTKRDLVDADWLALVEEETRERVKGTVLDAAPLVSVSATTGEGLDALRTALDRTLAQASTAAAVARPRLPIDRVFTVSGFGTVVTGTLTGGELRTGQELRVMPRDLPTRVRGLQTHKAKVDLALPGSRVAVNVAGLAVDELRRGDVLSAPGALRPTQRVDARLRLLADAPAALAQNDQVDLFVGAAELPAWATLLDRERLEPGETGWVQFRFRQPLAVLKGDRFIVRRASPSSTIGGGEIVDANPIRHRRFRPEVLDALETLAAGSPDEIVLQRIERQPIDVRTLRVEAPSGLAPAQIDAAIGQLVAEGDARLLTGARAGPLRPGDYVVAATTWLAIVQRMVATVDSFHAANPLRRGMPKEELKSRLRLGGPPRLFDEALATAVHDGAVVDDGATVRLPTFAIRLDEPRRAGADRFLAALAATPYAPPGPAEFGVDADTLGALVDLGQVVKVADGVVFAPEAMATIERTVGELIDQNGSLTLADFRDHFGTSRKYAQATLEYLDQRRVTRRVGDERVRFLGAGAGTGAGQSTGG